MVMTTATKRVHLSRVITLRDAMVAEIISCKAWGRAIQLGCKIPLI
jgi:hypothetical protein